MQEIPKTLKSLDIRNLGPIGEANIEFGDLTIFVGPQATGKSIALQMAVLAAFPAEIEAVLEVYDFVWGASMDEKLDTFLGKGMSSIWNSETIMRVDGQEVTNSTLEAISQHPGPGLPKANFTYIPAQRVLAMAEGRARYFAEWEDAPFVLRRFGEFLRDYLIRDSFDGGEIHLSQPKTTEWATLNDVYDRSIFHGSKVIQASEGGKRRVKLQLKDTETSIPFISMSAGQKEFIPLYFALRYLMPDKATTKIPKGKLIIIEEPEMGLHPKAIVDVMFNILILVAKGYQVVLSTHSPVVLEVAWALNILQAENGTVADLGELLGLKEVESLKTELEKILQTQTKTYYFDNAAPQTVVRDISTLDAGAEDLMTAQWGGLSSFAERAGNLVAKVVSRNF